MTNKLYFAFALFSRQTVNVDGLGEVLLLFSEACEVDQKVSAELPRLKTISMLSTYRHTLRRKLAVRGEGQSIALVSRRRVRVQVC